MIIPNGQTLIDDSKKNIELWNENGGNGLVFGKIISDNKEGKVKSLEFLLNG